VRSAIKRGCWIKQHEKPCNDVRAEAEQTLRTLRNVLRLIGWKLTSLQYPSYCWIHCSGIRLRTTSESLFLCEWTVLVFFLRMVSLIRYASL
jgi:hypothetical protein